MKADIANRHTENKTRSTDVPTKAVKFERLLFKVFLAVFLTLVAAQAALLNPAIRSSSEDQYYTEGEPLNQEAYLFTTCKMELRLINANSCPELKVLVNGSEYAAFDSDTVLVDLKDGDVVELDAGSVLIQASVRISAVSENIGGLLGKTIHAEDGIVPVAAIHTAR